MGATIKLFLSWTLPIFTFGGVAARFTGRRVPILYAAQIPAKQNFSAPNFFDARREEKSRAVETRAIALLSFAASREKSGRVDPVFRADAFQAGEGVPRKQGFP
jgi:hypothetical protein